MCKGRVGVGRVRLGGFRGVSWWWVRVGIVLYGLALGWFFVSVLDVCWGCNVYIKVVLRFF